METALCIQLAELTERETCKQIQLKSSANDKCAVSQVGRVYDVRDCGECSRNCVTLQRAPLKVLTKFTSTFPRLCGVSRES